MQERGHLIPHVSLHMLAIVMIISISWLKALFVNFSRQQHFFYRQTATLIRVIHFRPRPGDSLYKHRGNFGVLCVLCECDIRNPSVVQLGQLNEISDSNINSSASLMRTMRGNRFSKERHYGSSCGDRRALFTKVIEHRGLETVHHTSFYFPLLC